jgi:hypothetical protein
MSRLSRLIVLAFALLSTSALAARWSCNATCFLSSCGEDRMGTSFIDVSSSGSSYSEAHGSASRQCDDYAARSSCHHGSLMEPVPCSEVAPPPAKFYKIVYKNNCREHGEIWSAIHYLNLSGKWETQGYWGIAYGETKVVAHTTNRYFDYHGHTSKNNVWGTSSNSREVNSESKPFANHEIPSGTTFGTYTFSFNCGN